MNDRNNNLKKSKSEKQSPTVKETNGAFIKRFNTMQRGIILSGIIGLGVVIIVLLFQINPDLDSNDTLQSGGEFQDVERNLVPKASIKKEQQETEQQEVTDESYVENKVADYESQIEELGEVPEGYVVLQDIDGTVSYISEEEYNALLNQDVRENTVADPSEDPSETMQNIEIEIMPADGMVWHQITAYPIDEINGDDIYQSRGQFIYFAQKALSTLYAQPILASNFDTETYTLKILLDEDAVFPLPDDFEDRMFLAYQNSGYQTEAPDQLTIEYDEVNFSEFMEND